MPLDTRQGRAALRAVIDRLRGYFLTQEGRPRGEKFGGTGESGGRGYRFGRAIAGRGEDDISVDPSGPPIFGRLRRGWWSVGHPPTVR